MQNLNTLFDEVFNDSFFNCIEDTKNIQSNFVKKHQVISNNDKIIKSDEPKIIHTDKYFNIQVNVAGISKTNIHVAYYLSNSFGNMPYYTLTIDGTSESKEALIRHTFNLTTSYDLEKTKSSYVDGILTLTIPTKTIEKRKKEINTISID